MKKLPDLNSLRRKEKILCNSICHSMNNADELEGLLSIIKMRNLAPEDPNPFNGMLDKGKTVKELRKAINQDLLEIQANIIDAKKELVEVRTKLYKYC